MTTIPDLQYLHYPQNFSLQKRAWLKWAHARSLRRADRVSVYSDWVREDILERYGTKWENKVVTIPIPVSWERFGTGSGRKRERPYLLAVGGHYLHKNLSTLLTAFREVHSKRPDVQLVVVGQTREFLIGVRQAEDVRAKIASLGLEGAVVVTGFIPVEELGDLYRGAELFVFPSVFEGFGLPPVEAIGFGLPVLTTDRASLPEVTRGLAETVDDPLDASGMAEHILHMLDTARRPDPEAVVVFREHYCPRAIAARMLWELVG